MIGDGGTVAAVTVSDTRCWILDAGQCRCCCDGDSSEPVASSL